MKVQSPPGFDNSWDAPQVPPDRTRWATHHVLVVGGQPVHTAWTSPFGATAIARSDPQQSVDGPGMASVVKTPALSVTSEASPAFTVAMNTMPEPSAAMSMAPGTIVAVQYPFRSVK